MGFKKVDYIEINVFHAKLVLSILSSTSQRLFLYDDSDLLLRFSVFPGAAFFSGSSGSDACSFPVFLGYAVEDDDC